MTLRQNANPSANLNGNDSRRMFLWALLFAISLSCLAQGTTSNAPGVGAPVTPPAGSPVMQPAISPLSSTRIDNSAVVIVQPPSNLEPQPVDIFSVRTWQPASSPVGLKSDLPPKPQAPPLPFRFLGKINEPEKELIFLLTRGERVLSVNVGQVINGTYLVEKYAAGRLYFIYKPLKVRQSILVGHPS